MKLTPRLLLSAYAQGFFPMARSRREPALFWLNPDQRGIIPLESFCPARSLQRLLRRRPFEVTHNRDFAGVIDACATTREDSWINDRIIALYTQLHEQGYAHSVECWQDKRLVGGIYGVALGAAFFAESMFSRVTSASKVALVTLVELLREAGFVLFDVQYVNPHLRQFGAVEIPRQDYMRLLEKALKTSLSPSARFFTGSPSSPL